MKSLNRNLAGMFFFISFAMMGFAIFTHPIHFVNAVLFWTLGIITYIDSKLDKED